MNEIDVVADRHGIVRRFLAWTQRADAEGRADAVSALARAYLYSDLSAETRAEAAIGLTAVLDDPSALVRRALAEALASASDAPRHIVLSLAGDQSDVASVVLSRSPALTDAELVDCAAAGDVAAQAAVARRSRLAASVAAAVAEIGERDAVLALADNLEADLSAGSLWRILERFGDDAEMREALLTRGWLPPALRNELVAMTAQALADFTTRCDWLSDQRAERIMRDAREQATVAIARACEGDDLSELVRRMRASGALTVAVLMRSLLSGDCGFFVQAMAELSGMPLRRAAAFARSPSSHGFGALYAKARLPVAFLPAFRAAVDGARLVRGGQISLALAEQVIAASERNGDPAAAPLRALLARLAGEAAREEARAFALDAAFSAPKRPALTYMPLLIDAVAAALDDDATPPVEAPRLGFEGAEDQAPLVQLPPDMLSALADAA